MDYLIAHLVGDFVFQTDWMAKYKGNPHPTAEERQAHTEWVKTLHGDVRMAVMDLDEGRAYHRANVACLLHVALYTLAVWLFTGWGLLPLAVTFACHFAQDRFRLASRLMDVTGHAAFKTGPLSPWSIVVFDNTLHLVQLWLCANYLAGVSLL